MVRFHSYLSEISVNKTEAPFIRLLKLSQVRLSNTLCVDSMKMNSQSCCLDSSQGITQSRWLVLLRSSASFQKYDPIKKPSKNWVNVAVYTELFNGDERSWDGEERKCILCMGNMEWICVRSLHVTEDEVLIPKRKIFHLSIYQLKHRGLFY